MASAISRTVVGVEIHARVKASTKLFSGASAMARDITSGRPIPPNSQVGWLDCGLPGAMPRLNQVCVDQAIATGLALEGSVQPYSTFERKHYFYCDSPLGYQITQQSHPIILGGHVELSTKTKVRISRIQLEQDTAKSFHTPQSTLVDFNRAGVALMEIVSEPDMSSPKEASEYVRTVQKLLRHIGSCDGNMEDGSLRADVNVSILRADGRSSHRVEVKNLNSLRSIERAVEYEATRLESLPRDVNMSETRSFDVKTGETVAMREKEGKVDYRFMPEPDLPPLIISPERVERVQRRMNELPELTRNRLLTRYGLRTAEVSILLHSPELLSYFEDICASSTASPPLIANVLCNTLIGAIRKEVGEDEMASVINKPDLVELLNRLEAKSLKTQEMKELISSKLVKGEPINWTYSSVASANDRQTEIICEQVVKEFSDEVAKYKAGKHTLFNFFFGKAFSKLKASSSVTPDVDQVKRVLKQVLEKQ